MELNSKLYKGYIEILNRELIPATGCTEPISIAYAAAVARDTLGAIPDKVLIEVSGNIIKNVKSVVVPNTGGMRGIKSACAIGIIGGDASKKLEVIANITAEQIKATEKYLKHDTITVSHADTPHIFDIIITMYKDNHHSYVRIVDYHTNIVKIKRDDKISFEKEILSDDKSGDRNILTVENIVKFADILKIEDVKVILDQQIEYNMAIAEEGLKNQYGANIGKIILKTSTDVPTKAKAYAAAGSDARMNGCEMPVIINSGSGNQGITTSVPLIIFARENKLSKEKMYRALTLANLITLHLKSGIGRLSAYCGAVSAGCGVASGISYLLGGSLNDVSHTLVNALAINSGIICDGAKSSCAAKIASSVEGGMLALRMYQEGYEFYDGEGIVEKGVENTIKNISKIARDGMLETDKEIIKIMCK
jgi:L-cysteine desulfidase